MKQFHVSRRSAPLPNNENPIQGVYDHIKSIKRMDIVVDEPFRCGQVAECLSLMDKLTLNDIGLSTQELSEISSGQCVNIADENNFQISAFILPKGCSIPLHNHPYMAVCTKVIFGEMRLQSFTPSPSLPQPSGDMDCTLVFDGIKSNSDAAWLLTPIVGNIHSFQAITTCVVFDVLLPPYDDPQHPCVFYRAEPRSSDPGCKDYELKVLSDFDFQQLPDLREYHGYIPREYHKSSCLSLGVRDTAVF